MEYLIDRLKDYQLGKIGQSQMTFITKMLTELDIENVFLANHSRSYCFLEKPDISLIDSICFFDVG